jgi:hypothetical protein
MPFYENLGFHSHPFVHTNADEEKLLEEYFVPPPFFDGVIGDPANPSPAIVLAPRGGGKSAQRRQIESWSPGHRVLAVTYDRFEFGVAQAISDIGLPYHLRNIITRILISYLSYLSEYPDTVAQLSKEHKQALSLFVHTYLGSMSGGELQEILKGLRGLPERFRDFWSRHVGILEFAVNAILKQYKLDAIDLPDVRHEEKKLIETYKYQLETLIVLVRQLDFASIYILVDKLDETELTGNDAEKTYQLLRPLVKDLELLGMNGYGYKFFLWDRIYEYFQKDARPDRVSQFNLEWSRRQLESVLSRRISAFSGGRVASFQMLMSEHPGFAVDSVMCLMANRSPRNLIRMCERVLAAQAELNPLARAITPTALDRGILSYSETIVAEQYGNDTVKDLQRVGREAFTINYLASNIFKTAHENTSRNKVTAWSKAGAVAQLGTVAVVGARRPLNFYYIADPAMIRLVHRQSDLKTFVEERWLECGNCAADNLVDIGLVPEGNELTCYRCGRVIV